jgi:hypothetical protein
MTDGETRGAALGMISARTASRVALAVILLRAALLRLYRLDRPRSGLIRQAGGRVATIAGRAAKSASNSASAGWERRHSSDAKRKSR